MFTVCSWSYHIHSTQKGFEVNIIAAGKTARGSTNWTSSANGVKTFIDTGIPNVISDYVLVTSVHGTSHNTTTGTSQPYEGNADTEFSLHVAPVDLTKTLTPSDANALGLHVHWIAVAA